jgi:uncharacterized Zn finger protein
MPVIAAICPECGKITHEFTLRENREIVYYCRFCSLWFKIVAVNRSGPAISAGVKDD